MGVSILTRKYIRVDTKNILFICGGAFSGLDRIIRARTKRSSIGFGADIPTSGVEEESLDAVLADLESEDLIKYGLIPEFVGRLPVFISRCRRLKKGLGDYFNRAEECHY